jgi:hypothetical protein
MPSRRLELEVISCSASISSCEKGSQWAQALALLREMPSRRLEPGVVSYSASISACVWHMHDCALALLREMPPRRVQPGVVSYSAALSACENSLLWAQALLLLREMLMTKVELCIDIHGLFFVTNLLHQVDVWDDVVDYSIHHFIHDQVLCGLS